jgi:hypothetical protein
MEMKQGWNVQQNKYEVKWKTAQVLLAVSTAGDES